MTPVAALVSGGLDSAVLVAWLARRGRRVVPIYIRQGLAWESAEQWWLRRWLARGPYRRSVRRRVLAVFPPPSRIGGGVAPLVTLALPIADLYGRHWSVSGRGVPRAADPDEAVELPGRNLLLVAKAAVYAAQHRIPVLALGALKGNPFPDARPVFWRAVGRAASLGLGRPIRVIAPLAARRKTEVIQMGRRLGVPLALTFSCIHPKGRRPCGRCQKCEERRRGFEHAGIDEHEP